MRLSNWDIAQQKVTIELHAKRRHGFQGYEECYLCTLCMMKMQDCRPMPGQKNSEKFESDKGALKPDVIA